MGLRGLELAQSYPANPPITSYGNTEDDNNGVAEVCSVVVAKVVIIFLFVKLSALLLLLKLLSLLLTVLKPQGWHFGLTPSLFLAPPPAGH